MMASLESRRYNLSIMMPETEHFAYDRERQLSCLMRIKHCSTTRIYLPMPRLGNWALHYVVLPLQVPSFSNRSLAFLLE